ncbi:hypothetical protein [Sulfurospirillum multivorans]|uniref:Uncharacterized protein n=1 Tax=Sulfurospirillum multivorans (strain DM 12446 / JCM 15788 / NBRC 109480) TaxID=1150621 RepID=A0AA86DZJ3_SULMK|nr:hypothetical protein [Sulfurospirillum multivorans]AHJ12850.1 hypothetical protein SMUL_1590 [Sulfurospirillum multivorans DSM 12446]
MSLHVIPLIQEFYLATDRIEIPENKIIPTSAGKNGKIESGYVLQKSHPYYEIDTLYWRTTPLVNRIFIIHFQEILLAFIHSQLMSQKNYAIFNYERANGIKLYLHPKKPTNICIEVFDRKAKNFILAETLDILQNSFVFHSKTTVKVD